jgi:hypothetical protein
MLFSAKTVSCFGVLEYWSTGVLEKAKPEFHTEQVLIITPLLPHYITPGDL